MRKLRCFPDSDAQLAGRMARWLWRGGGRPYRYYRARRGLYGSDGCCATVAPRYYVEVLLSVCSPSARPGANTCYYARNTQRLWQNINSTHTCIPQKALAYNICLPALPAKQMTFQHTQSIGCRSMHQSAEFIMQLHSITSALHSMHDYAQVRATDKREYLRPTGCHFI